MIKLPGGVLLALLTSLLALCAWLDSRLYGPDWTPETEIKPALNE